EEAQENIGESAGQSRIQRGGQGRSPSQSLGGHAKLAHLRPSLVRLRSSSNSNRAGRAKVNSSGRSSDNRRASQRAASREDTQMPRGTLMVAAGLVLGAGGLIAAQHNEKHDAVRTLAVRQIAEKLDGKESNATAVEVTLEPGQVEVSHRHPGPAFGYVLEGEY